MYIIRNISMSVGTNRTEKFYYKIVMTNSIKTDVPAADQ